MRKKAKYLHDAPAEALMPGFAGHYHMNGSSQAQSAPNSNHMGSNGIAISQAGTYMTPAPSSNFPQFSRSNQMGPPALMDNNDTVLTGFPNSQSVDASRYQNLTNQQVSPQTMTPGLDQRVPQANSASQSFDTSYIDPNDPGLFNFNLNNIAELNFGNHYGALEFDVLGQMSSGAMETPDVEHMNPLGGRHGSLSYDTNSGFPSNNFNFNQGLSWQNVPTAGSRHSSTVWSQSNGLDALAIGELAGQSPHSQTHDMNAGLPSPDNHFGEQHPQQDLLRHSFTQPQRKPLPNLVDPVAQKKRRRDTSEIYTSVTAPYPYTQCFHALTAFLQKRFPTKKTLRVAKALASIRPSFISCNKSLNHDDLIFMEKCFQRTLWEYEDFIGHYGTPTIICRRTGEVAAVSKEFSLVTGWRRDVLLGQEPNLNVNTGGNPGSSGTQTATSSRGAVTPRLVNAQPETGRPQPVFLAELMDEDSVVRFYEDFAELAFGASREAIVGQECHLLKYKTRDDPGWGSSSDQVSDDGKRIKRMNGGEVKGEIKGESGPNGLGDKDGRLQCTMCWTVKRDVFDIPMLIVMNVSLPCRDLTSKSSADNPRSSYQSSDGVRGRRRGRQQNIIFFLPVTWIALLQWRWRSAMRLQIRRLVRWGATTGWTGSL